MRFKECRLCHRVGFKGFNEAGGENNIYECANDRACNKRVLKNDSDSTKR